jgi:uncharacterized protein with HEPN domain
VSKDLLYLESIAEALERIRCYTQDVLIHDYLRVNLDQVWQTVDRDLPPLNISIGSMIARVSAG